MLLILLYTLLSIVVLTLGFLYIKFIRPEKQVYDIFRAQGIPGEPFVPLLGQLPELRKKRNADQLMIYHEELSKKHGYLFQFGFGPLMRLIIMDPDLISDVLSRTNAPNYGRPKDWVEAVTSLIGIHSLLITNGYEHERARQMINPAFYHSSLISMVSIIVDRTEKAIQSVFSNGKTSKPVELVNLFNSLTLSIIASCGFGADLERNANARDVLCRVFAESLEMIEYRWMRMINQIGFLARLPFWKKKQLDAANRTVTEFMSQIIADRRDGRSKSMTDGPDLLDLLLSAVDKEGKPFSDVEIKDECLTFVIAGSETTGNLMTWLMFVLMENKSVLEACREEVDRVLPNGTLLTDEHLSQLNVCEAVINEALRLYPPAPFFGRMCLREHTIGTKTRIVVPKHATVLINTYILHRREDLWPRPLEFDYTRWMRDPKTGLKPKLSHPFAYLPFAAGSSNCIGQNFAVLEAKIILAMFIQQCSFDMIPGQKVVPELKTTMRPKYGLWATVTKRQ